MTHPTCPDCGAVMRQTRRGATLAKRGPGYVCPVADQEQTKDADGRLRRKVDAKHTYIRVWSENEVTE